MKLNRSNRTVHQLQILIQLILVLVYLAMNADAFHGYYFPVSDCTNRMKLEPTLRETNRNPFASIIE